VLEEGREEREIDRSSITENGSPYFIYVAIISISFCISMASLYFLGKYDVLLAIMVVLNSI